MWMMHLKICNMLKEFGSRGEMSHLPALVVAMSLSIYIVSVKSIEDEKINKFFFKLDQYFLYETRRGFL